MPFSVPQFPRSGLPPVDKFIASLESWLKDVFRQLPVSVSASPKVGPRPEIHFIAGSNMTITAADNKEADRIDVTLSSSGGGGGGLPPDGTYADIVVSAVGTLWNIVAGAVGTSELAAGAVTTAKIAGGAVGTTELGASAVSTAKVANDAIDNTKLANMADATVKGRAAGAGSGDPQDLVGADLAGILSGSVFQSPGWFGDASDGNWTAPAGTTTLSRPHFFDTVTIPVGSTVITAGCPLRARTSITVNGSLIHDGGNATLSAAGGGTSGATLGFAPAPGTTNAGASGTTGAGTSGSGASMIRSGGYGGRGGNGTNAGANYVGTNSPGTNNSPGAFANTVYCPCRGFPDAFFMSGTANSSTQRAAGAGCGGSSGGGGGVAGVPGGGGGGGGGIVIVMSPSITVGVGGAISARGGNGGNGSGAGNAGGGGGGGGGHVALLYKTLVNNGTISANGGVGGSGVGTGTAGANGGDGALVLCQVP